MSYPQIAVVVNGLTRLNKKVKAQEQFEIDKAEAKARLGKGH